MSCSTGADASTICGEIYFPTYASPIIFKLSSTMHPITVGPLMGSQLHDITVLQAQCHFKKFFLLRFGRLPDSQFELM